MRWALGVAVAVFGVLFLLPALVAGFALGRLARGPRPEPQPCRHTALDLAAAIPLSARVAWLVALGKAWGMDGSSVRELRERAAERVLDAKTKTRSWN